MVAAAVGTALYATVVSFRSVPIQLHTTGRDDTHTRVAEQEYEYEHEMRQTNERDDGITNTNKRRGGTNLYNRRDVFVK